MKNKTEIVTCRFLPKEKNRLLRVCKTTNISTSSLTRMAVNEYLNLHGVDEEGENSNDYLQTIYSEYREYMVNEWKPVESDMQDYRQTNLEKLERLKHCCDKQIVRIKKEKLYEESAILEQLDREDNRKLEDEILKDMFDD